MSAMIAINLQLFFIMRARFARTERSFFVYFSRVSDLGEFCVDLGVENKKYPKRQEGVEDKVKPHHIHLTADTEWK